MMDRRTAIASSYYNRLFSLFVLVGFLLIGFGLCAYYARAVHPFEDEFISMLASQAVQLSFLPILPSGLFYAKSLPYSMINGLYVGFVKMAGNGSLPEALQVPYRLPSVFIAMLTLALTYRVGRDWFSPLTGLIAAGLLAISPIWIVWGARVRMYGLAMCLTLVLLYAATRMAGSTNARRWRFVALVTLVAGLLNHPLAALLLPPLLVVVALWALRAKLLRRRFWSENIRPLAAWGLAFGGALVGSVLFVLNWLLPEYEDLYEGAGGTASTLVGLIAKIHISINRDSANQFLTGLVWGNSFNLPLFVAAFGGGLLLLLLWIVPRWRKVVGAKQRWGVLFLLILSAGTLIEFLVFVIRFSKNDRFLAPFLPLVFLLAGLVVEVIVKYLAQWRPASILTGGKHWASAALALVIVAAVGGMGRSEISDLFYEAPPAYEQALSFVKRQWRPGDVILIPLPAASGVYLGRTDYFAVDLKSQTKLLDKGDTFVDRWWGAPWIEHGWQLQDLLQKQTRVWFVADKGTYSGVFQSDWHFVEQHAMKLAWSQDNALVYVSGKPGIRLPDKPEHVLDANLNDIVHLQGYTSVITGSVYRVFLFWKGVSPAHYDLTQFVHIRDQSGKTVAQADFQPLKGEYPVWRWRPGEVVVDVVDIPIPAGIAAGEYRVLAGLYRWDTLERLPVTADTTGENAVELERIRVGGQAAK
jgi:hypothetical protein